MPSFAPKSPPSIINGGRLRLLAVDVDGTLLDSNHREDPASRAALTGLHDRGTVVVLASSRPPLAILPFVDWAGERPVPIIACQGAMTLELVGKKLHIRSERRIPIHIAKEVVQTCVDAGATVNWYGGTNWFVAKTNSLVIHEAKIVGFEPQEIDLRDISDPPHKLLVMSDSSEAHSTVINRIKSLNVNAEESKPGYLEITASGASKGKALERLRIDLGIDVTDTVAIGDGFNDLSMFSSSGLSVAMGNAPALVQERASFVTSSNDRNGVLAAIGRLTEAQR